MEVKAKAKYLRISPYKVRAVIPLVKGKNLKEAKEILSLTPRKGARLIKRLIDSAYANYRQKHPGIQENELCIKNLYADQGPTLKRLYPRARTRRDILRHRTSHVSIIITDEKLIVKK